MRMEDRPDVLPSRRRQSRWRPWKDADSLEDSPFLDDLALLPRWALVALAGRIARRLFLSLGVTPDGSVLTCTFFLSKGHRFVENAARGRTRPDAEVT